MSIGDQLKQAREQNGLSVQDVEQATKIRKKYIQAMEDNNFDILPGGTYIKGFLRNYARLVKLDSEALVQQYEIQYQSAAKTAEENDTVQGNTETKTNNKTVNWRPLAMLTALLAVAGMIYAAGIWPGQSQPNRATPPRPTINPG